MPSCERGCAPGVPAPGHRRRVFQPQRLQAALCGTFRFGQLGLQARHSSPELRSSGWRAGAAHIGRQVRQEPLQLRSGGRSACWREHGREETEQKGGGMWEFLNQHKFMKFFSQKSCDVRRRHQLIPQERHGTSSASQ